MSYICYHCKKTFKELGKLELHIESVTDKKFEPSSCHHQINWKKEHSSDSKKETSDNHASQR